MKIAYFSDTYLPTVNGISYAIQGWKEELERRGHEATVFCPAPGNKDDNVTFKSVNFPFYEGFRASVFPPIKHDFSDYDIIHINSFFGAGVYGMWAAKKNNLPLLSTVHTPIEEYLDYVSSSKIFQKFAYSVYHEWETYIINKSQLCLTPTEAVKREIKDTVLKDVEVLSNGVDTRFFSPTDDSSFRDDFNITSDRVIGYTGRLGREKRLEELIAVAEDFDGDVIIGGDGPMREQYETMARNHENITFLGFLDRERLPELYSCLDIFIFPSRVETEGLVALEANACGTPVVGADAGGLQNTVINERNGLRYTPGDIKDLYETIKEAYSMIESLEQDAVEVAEEKSLATTVDRLLEHYENVEERFVEEKDSSPLNTSRLPSLLKPYSFFSDRISSRIRRN